VDAERIIDYLVKERDDIGRLDPFYEPSRRNGQFAVRLRDGERLQQEMMSAGPWVLLPMLQAMPRKIRVFVSSPTVPEQIALGYAQLVTANALDLSKAFGAGARASLVSGLSDGSPVVRAMCSHFLAWAEIQDRSSIACVEQLFRREQNEFARMAAAVTILISKDTTKDGYKTARRTGERWADTCRPGWRRLGPNEDRALTVAFVERLPFLLVAQSSEE
jgi:hypothetical protein